MRLWWLLWWWRVPWVPSDPAGEAAVRREARSRRARATTATTATADRAPLISASCCPDARVVGGTAKVRYCRWIGRPGKKKREAAGEENEAQLDGGRKRRGE